MEEMENEATVDHGIGESSTILDTKVKPSKTEKTKHKSILSRIWNGLFRTRKDDFEKRLQHISKEECAVQARLEKRHQQWRRMSKHLKVFFFMLESIAVAYAIAMTKSLDLNGKLRALLDDIIAVAYAIIMTKSLDLHWKQRAFRVLPMFLWPALFLLVYTSFESLLKMCNGRDQKTLRRLQTERQAKIDELKEKSNYYITQQLIQMYDTDPTAKAAAASVLASRLGADCGLKVFLGDELKMNSPEEGRSSDVELVKSTGLRNRKQHVAQSGSSAGSSLHHSNEGTVAGVVASHEPNQQATVEHHSVPEPTTVQDGGWLARMVALLMADDPKQSYALICKSCRRHNGLAREEDFPHITYYCPHCHALNVPKQTEDRDVGDRISDCSGSVSEAMSETGTEI